MKYTCLKHILGLALLGLAFGSQAQPNAKLQTTINPLNLNYRFQLATPSRREAADPAAISFKGKYLLFASKSGGYWWSDDLLSWKFLTTKDLPLEDYAPAVVVMRDSVFFMGLDYKIYKSADPVSGHWQVAKTNFPFFAGDPALFQDDDGRLYLYWGVSPEKPIYGIELNPVTFDPIGKPTECFYTNSKQFGWERTEDYNTGTINPWIEGPWVTKYQGKYYLQYAVGGTQWKGYDDGVYIGKTPLGPFKAQELNPVSYKPEGFIAGAGHSSTFQDKYGNYWHPTTMTISVKHRFERRLGLFPSFFDQDGLFYTYTGFGDFPHRIPTKLMKSAADYEPSWMLLSYQRPVKVSSTLSGHPAENLTGEDIRKSWSAATGNRGEWAMVDLQSACDVHAVQLNFSDEGTAILGRPDSIRFQYLLEYSNDQKTWKTLADKTRNMTDVPHDYIELSKPVLARYIRLTNIHVPDGKFALSGLRIFGMGHGRKPAQVTSLQVKRDPADGRNAFLHWKKSPGAFGYDISFGTRPDKLYLNYQVMGSDSVTIHSLDNLKNYYFKIRAFNGNGISLNSRVFKSAFKP